MANNTGIKYGGRDKGTPNRLTKELRLVLKDVIYNELEHIEDRLGQLEPKQRIELLIKLIPYALPKLETISHTQNEPLDWGFD
ncbi:MAG TPA: hypothetical protein DCR48_06695 [Flavobacteriales bacterium]|nr:hypothetical protein [Flavobacteriales bacterium]